MFDVQCFVDNVVFEQYNAVRKQHIKLKYILIEPKITITTDVTVLGDVHTDFHGVLRLVHCEDVEYYFSKLI